MSYSRFGPDSDVYIFDDVTGGTTCCGCWLAPEGKVSVNVKTHAEMITHVREHIAAGHEVPEGVIERLERGDG